MITKRIALAETPAKSSGSPTIPATRSRSLSRSADERRDRTSCPMPHMGVSVEEGTVVAWHKAPGDAVKADELICDIATDKVDTEVAAPAAGTVDAISGARRRDRRRRASRSRSSTGGGGARPLGDRRLSARAADAAPRRRLAPAESPVSSPAPRRSSGAATARALPSGRGRPGRARALRSGGRRRRGARAARRRAARLAGRAAARGGARRRSSAAGTGRRGRIRKADVLAAAGAGPASRGHRPATRAPATSAARKGIPAGYEDVPHEVVPTTRVRQAIAEHMIRSRQTAAHMTTEVDVDLSAVVGRARS